MTAQQIDALAEMIAKYLPGLVLQKSEVEGQPPFKPENLHWLVVQADDVKTIIRAALKQK